VKQPSAIIVVMLLSVVVLLRGAVPAFAETPEGRQACMNDAFQFCQEAIPDRERVFNCLAAHRDTISPACRAEVTPAAPVQPAALPPKPEPHAKGVRAKGLPEHSANRQAATEKTAKAKKAAAHPTKLASNATTKTKPKSKSTARAAAQRSGQPLNLLSR
jgi:hypothetical protein